MNENQGVKPVTWVIIAVIVIAIVVLGIYMFGGSSTPTTTPPVTTQTTTTTTPAAVNRIVVSDQFPGNVVYISSVQLAQPGWVVIEKDAAGTPGAVIGKQWFDKGINPGQITLSESTIDGGTYYAVLVNDNGDKVYNATTDLPLKDAAGNVIMKIFHATTAAVNTKG